MNSGTRDEVQLKTKRYSSRSVRVSADTTCYKTVIFRLQTGGKRRNMKTTGTLGELVEMVGKFLPEGEDILVARLVAILCRYEHVTFLAFPTLRIAVN